MIRGILVTWREHAAAQKQKVKKFKLNNSKFVVGCIVP
jgi:hypothetical protein